MRVTFVNDYTTPGGRHYKAGTSAEVENGTARSLIVRGKAVEETFHGQPVGRRQPAKERQKKPAGQTGSGQAGPTSATAETTNPKPGEKGKE